MPKPMKPKVNNKTLMTFSFERPLIVRPLVRRDRRCGLIFAWCLDPVVNPVVVLVVHSLADSAVYRMFYFVKAFGAGDLTHASLDLPAYIF